MLPEENAPVIAGKTGIVVGWGSKQAGVIQSMSLTLEYLELTVAPENFCKENLKELSVDIQFCTLVGNKTNVDRVSVSPMLNQNEKHTFFFLKEH